MTLVLLRLKPIRVKNKNAVRAAPSRVEDKGEVAAAG